MMRRIYNLGAILVAIGVVTSTLFAQQAQKPLTNDSVITMVKGESPDIVISSLKRIRKFDNCQRHLSPL